MSTAIARAPSEWPRFLGALRRARARLSEDPVARLSLAQYLLVEPLLDAPTRSVGELAANGRRIAAAERARFQRKGAELFAALEPAERAQAARLLGRLADLMEEL